MNGKIVQIIGAVIDVEFKKNKLPKIYYALKVEKNKFNFRSTTTYR